MCMSNNCRSLSPLTTHRTVKTRDKFSASYKVCRKLNPYRFTYGTSSDEILRIMTLPIRLTNNTYHCDKITVLLTWTIDQWEILIIYYALQTRSTGLCKRTSEIKSSCPNHRLDTTAMRQVSGTPNHPFT